MSIQTIGVILCFVVFVVLMMKRICPMAVAYPLMALAIAIIAGIPLLNQDRGFFSTLMESGAVRNSSHVAVLLISAWLEMCIRDRIYADKLSTRQTWHATSNTVDLRA